MQFLSKKFSLHYLFMQSARVNKAAILQRRQYLDPRAHYVPLQDQRQIKSLANSNGYIKPASSFSHEEVESTITVTETGYNYISTAQLFKTVSGKFYILKNIDTTRTGTTWYRSSDGTTWSNTFLDTGYNLYLSTFNYWCFFFVNEPSVGGFSVSGIGTIKSMLRASLVSGDIVTLTYEQVTPVY